MYDMLTGLVSANKKTTIEQFVILFLFYRMLCQVACISAIVINRAKDRVTPRITRTVAGTRVDKKLKQKSLINCFVISMMSNRALHISIVIVFL